VAKDALLTLRLQFHYYSFDGLGFPFCVFTFALTSLILFVDGFPSILVYRGVSTNGKLPDYSWVQHYYPTCKGPKAADLASFEAWLFFHKLYEGQIPSFPTLLYSIL
jgi:hypothetical protein